MNKMLIIDDSKFDREVLKEIFQYDFEVFLSDNPFLCINDVKNKKYDIVLVDYVMPVMNGLDFLHEVNPNAEINFTPIIIVSSEDDRETQMRAYSLGAVDYFIKPYNKDNFIIRALRAVNLYRNILLQNQYEISLKKGLNLLISNQSERVIMEKICKGITDAYNAVCCKLFFLEDNHYVCKYGYSSNGDIDIKAIVAGIDYQNISRDVFVLSEKMSSFGTLLTIDDIETIKDSSPLGYKALKALDVRNYVTSSIFANDKLIGFLSVIDYDTTIKQVPEITLGLCGGIGSYYIRMQYEKRLEFDNLTGLLRKEPFKEKMRQILISNPENKYTIVKMDISNFKIINTFYGFSEGNKLLILIGNAFKRDKESSLLASRVENDEFLVFVTRKSEEAFLNHIKYVKQYLVNHSNVKNLRINYGVYDIEDNFEDVEMIYSKASFANNQNKKGKNELYTLYKEEEISKVIEQQMVFDNFENALKNGEIVSYIQPKYDISSGNYCGGEALARWVKPDGTIIPPDRFIDVLEKTGLIKEMDMYLFSQMVICIRNWLDEGKKVLPISINLSKYNFDTENLYIEMVKVIDKYSVPHELIQIEITESIYSTNMDTVQHFCRNMIEQKILVLMDDFGTGYSSLNILKDLDISIIKLDYKFLAKSKNREKQLLIIISVIEMAKRLGLPVVIEGVETKEDVEFFKSIGVRYIQGYFFGKPMKKEEFIKLIN